MMAETLMKSEISEQPARLKDCLKYNEATFAALKTAFAKKPYNQVVLAARGSSDNACTYFKYLCEIKLGLPCSFAAPSVVTLYDGCVNFKDALVIGVSQSGQAADVRGVLERAKADGALTVSITNNLESPMAACSDFHIFLNAGPEKSVAATKTFLTQIFALGYIVATLSEDKSLADALKNIDKTVAEVIKLEPAIAETAKSYARATDCYVLTRGINYCSCQEAALKIQETTYIKAKAYASSDFHHGPFAVIDRNASVILMAPTGKCFDDNVEMFDKLKAASSFVTVMSDDEALVKRADNGVVLPSVCECVTPFVYCTAAQLFALNLALSRGVNPDAPRGLNKVTITK